MVFLSSAERVTFDGLDGATPRRGDAPARLVLHTTEGRSLPEYSSPPHFTVAVGHPDSMPSLPDGGVKVWQHVSLDKTAYALHHPHGTEETNHMGSHCVQIEIVTCVGDNPKARIVGNRGHLVEPLLRAVADLVREILTVVPGINPRAFPAENQWSANGSAGPNAPQRFSVNTWRNFNGICGHQHVPANNHWDPGDFDITGFVGLVLNDPSMPLRSEDVPEGPTPPPDTGWPRALLPNTRSRKVAVVRGLLQALGFGDLGDSELYNAEVEEAVRAMQTSEAIGVDGKWGPESHRAALRRLQAATARADVTT